MAITKCRMCLRGIVNPDKLRGTAIVNTETNYVTRADGETCRVCLGEFGWVPLSTVTDSEEACDS